jgi:hypothetical protein
MTKDYAIIGYADAEALVEQIGFTRAKEFFLKENVEEGIEPTYSALYWLGWATYLLESVEVVPKTYAGNVIH